MTELWTYLSSLIFPINGIGFISPLAAWMMPITARTVMPQTGRSGRGWPYPPPGHSCGGDRRHPPAWGLFSPRLCYRGKYAHPNPFAGPCPQAHKTSGHNRIVPKPDVLPPCRGGYPGSDRQWPVRLPPYRRYLPYRKHGIVPVLHAHAHRKPDRYIAVLCLGGKEKMLQELIIFVNKSKTGKLLKRLRKTSIAI